MKSQRIRLTALVVALACAVAALPAAAAGAQSVNVNTATVEQLQLLPNVGPAVAARIVEHREKNGPFKAAEDLMLVRGIGEKSFEKLRPYVATSGQTTLTDKVRLPKAPAESKG